MNLMVCKNEAWATSTCDYLCQQSGFGSATSCQHDANKGYETCFCASASGTCKEGEQKCNGMTLSICNGGSWSTAGCDFICQQANLGPPQSCGFDSQKNTELCFCSAAPTCVNGAQKCQGSSLQTCINSGWQTDLCDDLCHAGGLGKAESCAYNANKGMDSCLCFDGNIGDPCSSNLDCKQDQCGAAGWCTKLCENDAECGASSTANNFCIETQGGGGACFPSCTANASCSGFINATCFFNVASKNGVNAAICATN